MLTDGSASAPRLTSMVAIKQECGVARPQPMGMLVVPVWRRIGDCLATCRIFSVVTASAAGALGAGGSMRFAWPESGGGALRRHVNEDWAPYGSRDSPPVFLQR